MNRPPAFLALCSAAILLFFVYAFADDYISKTYIDTTIQRAYYNLNAATDVAGMGPKMEEAISFAKQLVTRLKNIARGNPNEKYILWKVGELESQVYLEENGLLLEKENKRQKLVNDLIGPFNAELRKQRPSFSQLVKIHDQMNGLNPAKAFDMKASIDDRKKNISRAITNSIENAMADANYTVARQELAYLKDNQEYMGISLTGYSQIAAKVQAKLTLDNERQFINEYASTVEDLLEKSQLADARNACRLIDDRLDGIKDLLLRKEYDKYFFRSKHLKDAIEHKEDSLVRVTLAILRDQGIIAAYEYCDDVLRKRGVLPEKVSSVDFAILERAIANKKLQDTSVVKQLASMPPPTPDDTGTLFNDLLVAAKKKAKEKADSALATQGGRTRMSQAEEIRLANMRLAQEGKKKRNDEMLKENKDRANNTMIAIYTMLEKGDVKKAYDEYNDRKTLLARYIPAPEFSSLDSMVNARYAAIGKKKK
jgi:hypothetical protein